MALQNNMDVAVNELDLWTNDVMAPYRLTFNTYYSIQNDIICL